MTNSSFFNQLRTFKKRKQLLIATLVSVAVYAVWQLIAQLQAGEVNIQTLGYLVAPVICFFMGKEIFNNSGNGGERIKEEDSEEFYGEEKN